LYEAKVLGEAGQYPEQQGASGKIDFNYAKVYVQNNPPSSSSVATSSAVTPTSSEVVSSSNSVPPTSSVSATPTSSSAVVNSSSTIALPVERADFRMAGSAQVFDMLGKYLGTVELNAGVSVKELLLTKFGKSGTFLLKRGASSKVISVEKR
jgi:hypothetical protein